MEYDEDSGKYYCPKCEKHWEPVEAEQKETIYQDTTENLAPWDGNVRTHEEDEVVDE
jgi:uncharacterized Zn ribbon protein